VIARKEVVVFLISFVLFGVFSVYGMDGEVTRRTLANLPGFYISFEEFQPNFKQHAAGTGITREQLQMDIELRLRRAGIGNLSQEQWLKTQGRPVLYVNVNTHIESANIAYSIRMEVRQIVFTDSNPAVKTLGGTWGINMTGIAKQSKTDVIKQDLMIMVDKFVEAYWAANRRDGKRQEN
jgi:hypothetical protein